MVSHLLMCLASKKLSKHEPRHLKGLYQELNIFLKAFNNEKVLSVHALIVFTIFCHLEKIRLKVLAGSF
jgi:hypothetical protein